MNHHLWPAMRSSRRCASTSGGPRHLTLQASSPVSASWGWFRASLTSSTGLLLAALVVLTLIGCGERAASPTATLTASPTATTEPASPTAIAASDMSPGPSPQPSPTRSPMPTGTRPPNPVPVERALAPTFRSDADLLPNATRYQIHLTLNVAEATLSGVQKISYTNTETVPLDHLYLRLSRISPGYGGQMSVIDLAVDGQPVSTRRELEGSALHVPLPSVLAPGAHADVTLAFTVKLPTDVHPADSRQPYDGYRQFGLYNGIAALANAYPIIPVYDDEGWNLELAPSYGDAVFSDVAFYEVSVTAPKGMRLVGSGTCLRTLQEAATTTWSCVAAPMRDFNAIVGNDYQLDTRDVDGIAVNSVFYAADGEGGAAALDYAARALRLFNAQIGPYPFAELDVVETPTLAGGIEYPGLIVINESYYDSDQGVNDRMEWVVVHETLHQWWYSLVGNDQVDEPWLDEALVQYCTALYYEDRYGQEALEVVVETSFRQSYRELQESGRDQPVGLPVAEYSRQNYGPVVYQKGPLYFHSLRQEVGLETFWKILATYLEKNRYGIARSHDWLEAVEDVTGNPYQSLYNQWIHGAEE